MYIEKEKPFTTAKSNEKKKKSFEQALDKQTLELRAN